MKIKGKCAFNVAFYLVIICVFIFCSRIDAISAAPGGKGKPAKVENTIVMICDGWGYNHVDAASYYQYGDSGMQIYESFPFAYAMSTYMWGGDYDSTLAWSDFQYVTSGSTDSAAAATAMSTGIKTSNGAIGVDISGTPVKNVLECAEEQGKSTGVVTTVQFSHATPAGFVAHNESRSNYEAIAQEMIYDSATDVIMGCGNPWFDADGQLLLTPNTYMYVGGEDTWNDLVSGTASGDADGDGLSDDPWTLIQERAEFQSLMSGPTPARLIGIPKVKNTLQYDRSGNIFGDPYTVPKIDTVPTLEEMTLAALNVLDNDPDGFFLMIEGGAADWASHAHASGRVIEELIDFNQAVVTVADWVNQNSDWDRTLLIVTGDHECGYLLGPGSGLDSSSLWKPIVNNGIENLPGMEWYNWGHTNSLIPLFAKGTAASLIKRYANKRDSVRGSYLDNTEIAKTIFKCMNCNPKR